MAFPKTNMNTTNNTRIVRKYGYHSSTKSPYYVYNSPQKSNVSFLSSNKVNSSSYLQRYKEAPKNKLGFFSKPTTHLNTTNLNFVDEEQVKHQVKHTIPFSKPQSLQQQKYVSQTVTSNTRLKKPADAHNKRRDYNGSHKNDQYTEPNNDEEQDEYEEEDDEQEEAEEQEEQEEEEEEEEEEQEEINETFQEEQDVSDENEYVEADKPKKPSVTVSQKRDKNTKKHKVSVASSSTSCSSSSSSLKKLLKTNRMNKSKVKTSALKRSSKSSPKKSDSDLSYLKLYPDLKEGTTKTTVNSLAPCWKQVTILFGDDLKIMSMDYLKGVSYENKSDLSLGKTLILAYLSHNGYPDIMDNNFEDFEWQSVDGLNRPVPFTSILEFQKIILTFSDKSKKISNVSSLEIKDLHNLDEFLDKFNLKKHASVFENEELDLVSIRTLTETDIQSMKIPIAARKKLREGITYLLELEKQHDAKKKENEQLIAQQDVILAEQKRIRHWQKTLEEKEQLLRKQQSMIYQEYNVKMPTDEFNTSEEDIYPLDNPKVDLKLEPKMEPNVNHLELDSSMSKKLNSLDKPNSDDTPNNNALSSKGEKLVIESTIYTTPN